MKSRFLRLCKAAAAETDWKSWRSEHRDATKILVPFHMLLHPFACSSDIKFERRGSMVLANCLAFLYLLCGIWRKLSYGFIFGDSSAEGFNLWPVLLQTVGLLALWMVSSWALSSLMGGEGKLSEMWISTCYCLLPVILLTPITILMTNVFVKEEATVIALMESLMSLWPIFLLICSTLVIQQYTLGKTIGMILLTVLGMAAIIFLIMMFFSLFQQLYIFADTVIRELLMRV